MTTVRLDRVATVHARIGWKALTAAEYVDEGYAFLATPNIKSEMIDFENVNYVSAFRYDESPELKLRSDDVLLAKDGSTLGIANVVRDLPRPATVNGSIAVLRPLGIHSRFLMYALRSAPIQEWIEQVKDGMGVPHLFQADIKRIELPAPTLSEQRRIADYLDAECARLDRLVELRQRQTDLLQERSDTLALECLLLNDAQVSVGGDLPRSLPESWRVGRVKDVATRVDVGIAEAATHAYASSGVPLLRSTNIRAGRLETEDLLFVTHEFAMRNRAKTVHAGDILTVRTGSPGISAVIPRELDGCQTFTQLITTIDSRHIAEYFCAWLNAGWARSYFASYAWGSAQRNISVPILANAPVPIPPRPDQALAIRRLADELAPITRTRELLDHSTKLLRERKQALITAAVTGEFDVSAASGRGV